MDVMAPLGDFAREVGDAVYDRHGNELLGTGGRGRGKCLGKMRMGASRPLDARECKRRVCDSEGWRRVSQRGEARVPGAAQHEVVRCRPGTAKSEGFVAGSGDS